MTTADRDAIAVPCSARTRAKLEARITSALNAAGVVARDLARYYALLEREQPGVLVSPAEVLLIRAALPAYRAARRDGGEATLASAVAAHAALFGLPAAGLDVPALLERLRGLRPSQLLAVVDLAESVDEAALGDDVQGRERVRQRFGLSG
jgi:hypothetical protein